MTSKTRVCKKGQYLNTSTGRCKKIETKKDKTPIKGENIETEIETSIEDAFFGKKKTFIEL